MIWRIKDYFLQINAEIVEQYHIAEGRKAYRLFNAGVVALVLYGRIAAILALAFVILRYIIVVIIY